MVGLAEWRPSQRALATDKGPTTLADLTPNSIPQRNAPRGPGFIKNFDFSYQLNQGGARFTDFTVTAVAGHLTESDFDPRYKGWRSCDPFQLFDADIITSTSSVRTFCRS